MYYQIVPMDRSHIEQIARLEQACFSSPWTENMLADALFDTQASFIVAEDEEGNVLGYAGLHVIVDEGYNASALLDVFCRFGEVNLAFLTLEVRASNQAAIALYEKHGFTQAGLRKNYYDKPREDAVLMTRYFEKQ